ncbi:MAG: hypothetical protein Q8N91_05070 [Candidatus Omnitrophota bacterium]|nr:hypothetical protein [Candidatus Omnitrophota bacterium]
MKLKPDKLTHESIRPYGYIIDSKFIKDDGRGDKFGILLKERSGGWRIGYLILRKKRIARLENHPDSLETFEPVKGRAVIFLAANKDPEKIKAFFLDKPLVVKKGVWHDVACLSGRCEIKIFENIEVKTVYYVRQQS